MKNNKFQFCKSIFFQGSIILIVLALNIEGYGQKLVRDTLTISLMQKKQVRLLQVPITIHDKREVQKRFIGKDETTHYMFIPVDQLIYTKKSLPLEILSKTRLDSNNQSNVQLDLNIHYFWVSEKLSSLFYPHYQLNAIFSVYKNTKLQEPVYLGDLVYDTYSYKSFLGSNKRKGYSKVFTKWHTQFVDDINKIKKDNSLQDKNSFMNFRKNDWNQNPLNMLIGCDFIYGSDFYLTDIQVFFSNREAGSCFRSGGFNLRYRNMNRYETIEIGLSIDRLFYRLNPKFLFIMKSNVMLGINRWKDMKTADHTIYDILTGDVSLSQSIHYNPIDRASFIIGAGMYEEIIYNYAEDVKFNLALIMNIGIKL